MKADQLAIVEAFARGLTQGLLGLADVPAVANHPATTPPAKDAPPGNDPPGGSSLIPGAIPTPGFDHVEQPLPGFEDVPPITLEQMEAFMEGLHKKTPKDFYDPAEADQRAPLS